MVPLKPWPWRMMLNVPCRIVPEMTAFVIERFGRFKTTLGSGLHFLIPMVRASVWLLPTHPTTTTTTRTAHSPV